MNAEPASTLPLYPTTLIGRDVETEAVVNQLRAAQSRMVTLMGASGTGKTRLSLKIAEVMAEDFPAGRFFVALAPISDPSLVLSTIAHTVGVQEVGGQALIDTLITALAHEPILLILDNFEQVQSAAPEISRLLERTEQLKVLVTSQIPLNVAQESIFKVPPLSVPNASTPLQPDALMHFASVALFVDRLAAVQPHFVFTEQNARAVRELCIAVEGLPLAIELLAAHSATLSPHDLLMLIQHQLILGRSSGSREGRHYILWPVLDWCYRMLSSDLQALFARMGVFAGGSTLDSVEQICNRDNAIRMDVLTGIHTLVDKHLVLEETLADQEVRYIMLDAIHEYASLHLEKRPEHDLIREWHAAYYEQLTATAADALQGAQEQAWLARMEGEHHNVRSAMQWTLETQHAASALRMSGNLWNFWYVRGYLSEGRRWLARALEQRIGAPLSEVGKALNSAGILAWAQGDYPQARELIEESLLLHRELNDQAGIATNLNNLGMIAWAQGEYSHAVSYYQESLDLFRLQGNPTKIAALIDNLALVIRHTGDLSRARALHEEALAIRRTLYNPDHISSSLNNLAGVVLRQGEYEQAKRLYQEGLEIARSSGDQRSQAHLLTGLAEVLIHQHQPNAALPLAREALQINLAASDKYGIADSLERLSEVLVQINQSMAAPIACFLGAASALRTIIGAPVGPASQVNYQAMLARVRASLDAATWQAAWDRGQRMSLEEIIALAESTVQIKV